MCSLKYRQGWYRFSRKLLTCCQLALLVYFPTSPIVADPLSPQTPTRARLSYSTENLTVSPISLQGGSTLTVVSPEKWDSVADHLLTVVKKIHKEYSTLFGEIPSFVSSVRLIEHDQFLAQTGAPSWTNALYFRGEILIPISEKEKLDLDDLVRSIRHEYTHAVIHALSGGRCPGWLDEGLAEWSEGDENPALPPALSAWVKKQPIVSLKLLQGGFTKLDFAMVPAAYAESLFASNLILSKFGFDEVRTYFDLLRGGTEKSFAFQKSFGISESAFEEVLNTSLVKWAKDREATTSNRGMGLKPSK